MKAGLQTREAVMPALWLMGCTSFVELLGGTVFGICRRPVDFLASLWPANAIMPGLMLCNPQVAQVPAWMEGVAGYAR